MKIDNVAQVTRMNAAEATVAALLRNNINTIFGLPGLHNDPFFDAVHKTGGAMRVLPARHEQAAAYMALGAALSTGKPQAFVVVPGPGFLNAAAALLSAEATCAPVLGILGQIPQRDIDRNHGHLHEIHDQIGIASHISKYARRVGHANEAPRLIGEAIENMLCDRPGPAVLECAMDTWTAAAAVELPVQPARAKACPVDVELVQEAVKIIADARKPMIIVGGGALEAGREVQELAEHLKAPVLSYRRGRGVISTEHELAINLPVGHRLWPEVDVIIAIGTRLFIQEFQWGTDKDLKIVRIDADPQAPNRTSPPAVALVGDAASYTDALVRRLRDEHPARPHPAFDLAPHRAWFADRISHLEPQRGYLEAIRRALPHDGIFVDEVTQVGFASRLLFPVYSPRTFVSIGYQENLGWGYGAALGVKAANPDKAVVAVAGDGGFMYQVGELATAARHGIAVVVVVFDNAMFGNVKRIQQEQYGNRVIAADLTSPDFAGLARSFGVMGYSAGSPAELETALSKAIAADVPALVHVKCGEMPSAWDMLLMPKIRG